MPSEDDCAEWYGAACEWLDAAGVGQYEISNFARARDIVRGTIEVLAAGAVLGFGLDAHSMLRSGADAVRWANAGDLEEYLGDARVRLQFRMLEDDESESGCWRLK